MTFDQALKLNNIRGRANRLAFIRANGNAMRGFSRLAFEERDIARWAWLKAGR